MFPSMEYAARMGVLDFLLGGIVGGGMASIVSDILAKHGGVRGVVSEFEKNGFGPTVKSWVSTGPNLPISADDIHRALGSDLLGVLARRSGMSVAELTQKLTEALPRAVDHLTPDGVIPKQ